MVWVNAVVQGVLLGGLYALFAAGLSLVFGVMRLVNLAHGDFAVLSAYLALLLVETKSIHVTNDISIGWFPLLTFVTAVVVLVGLQLLIRRTSLGRALRATSDDRRAAQLVGIDNRRPYAVAMAISVATAAVAGIFLGIRTTFDPSAGPVRLIFAFEAVVIGGLGSLWGTLVGGAVLGVAQAIGAQISPGWGTLAGHFVFLAVLLVRPTGLFRTAPA